MFKFSLQRILDYRRQVREKVENEMASIAMAIESVKSSLSLLNKEIEFNGDLLGECERKSEIDLFEIRLLTNYIKNLEIQITKKKEHLLELLRQQAQKREELIKSSQQEQVMERLRDKEKQGYIEALGRAERLFLDEIAIRGYTIEKSK